MSQPKVNLVLAIAEAVGLPDLSNEAAYDIYVGMLKHKKLPGTEHMKSLGQVAEERPDLFKEMVLNTVAWINLACDAMIERDLSKATVH